MWAVKDYRSNSPGLRLVPYFLKYSGAQPGETLIDLGCGTGRAGQELAKHGFQVCLLDHVDALEADNRLPFIEANLWTLTSLGKLGRFDWFYCCDVMEHIPPEHVDATLANCARVAYRGFFQIAMFEESFGDRIGEKLHLTIENDSWWMAKLKKYFVIEKAGIVETQRLAAFVRSND